MSTIVQKVNNHDLVHVMSKVLLGTFILAILSFAFYMFFTGATIFNLVDAKNTESELKNEQFAQARLEQDLLDVYNGISQDNLAEFGFSVDTSAKYATRQYTIVRNDI